MKPFEYIEPSTLKEATRLLFDHGGKAKVLAGGVHLVPKIRKGEIKLECLVNIQKIPGLDYVKPDGKRGLRFGAMAKLRSMEISKTVQSDYPALYEAIHQITSVQAKCMGTAVGNLCVGTPASDVATALIALGGQLKITGARGERTEPIEKFYLGYHRTSLKRGEMVAAVFLPKLPPGTGTSFLNLVRTHSDIAKISVAVAVTLEDDICREARIAIGGAAPTVFRATKAEALLKGREITHLVIDQAAEIGAGETRPITDLRSTAVYRKEMAKVLVRRALQSAVEKAKA